MDNNEIKKENRKALPKIIFIMVISLLAAVRRAFAPLNTGWTVCLMVWKVCERFFAYILPRG